MPKYRELLRSAFYRSRLFRELALAIVPDNRLPNDLTRTIRNREEQVGPVHDDEALLLFALTRVLCPQTIVEFGFRTGHSAFTFRQAASQDCQIYSYDIWQVSEAIAAQSFGRFENFHFIRKSQIDFAPADIQNRPIDLCFMDASHNTSINLKTFDLIHPHLSDTALLAIHDTGLWHRKFFKSRHHAYADSDYGRSIGEWLDAERFQPAVTERLFVNTLLQTHPDFAQIHLHSDYRLRNGLTLLQRKGPLKTEPV